MAALVAGALLVVTASASANLVVTQSASPKPVKKGELVTITVTATNSGPRTLSGTDAGVDLFSLLGSTDRAADNPYQSATPSQGTCELKQQGAYHVASCLLGELGVGASAQITAVVRVIRTLWPRAAIRSAMAATCSGVLPAPNTTSGQPVRASRAWSMVAKPRSSVA